MSEQPPKLIAIDHDDYHAEYVGRTHDGRQFFLTTPFNAATPASPGREFVALYTFDRDGNLLQATIDDCGPRATLDRRHWETLQQTRLRELGPVSFERIEIAPFVVERDGLQFGLIPREPESEGGTWSVELQPGNFMAFYPPWDSGTYDT